MNTRIASSAPLQFTPSGAKTDGPWHEGEIHLQKLVGVDARMAEVGKRVLRDHLIDQHRQFYPQLPFAVFGAVDDNGDVWATLRANHPGFLSSPDPYQLIVAPPRDAPAPADAGMDDGKAIGMIGIELHTRRRNRLNGKITRHSNDRFTIRVGHSFGNCPQYIHLRDVEFTRDPLAPALPENKLYEDLDGGLDEQARAIISSADTFFVATYVDRPGENREVDVSHRGGNPGFVRIGSDGSLTIPDFAGNLFFNTLGNILSNPKAGLVFTDFATGDVLQITGDAYVIIDGPEIVAFQGAERLWRVFPRNVVLRKSALPIRWRDQTDGVSPNSLLTGDWVSANRKILAIQAKIIWQNLKITRIVKENRIIKSFHLEPVNGAGTLPYKAGQHLPIRVTIPGHDKALIRTYTLSNAPSDNHYRISVKREGAVSSHLHDDLKIGDVIEARAPAGDFFLDASIKRPAVLIAGGIGITPMISMLRHIVYEGPRTRGFRPTWLFYAARSLEDRAFDHEIIELVKTAQGSIRLVRVLADPTGAEPRKDYEASGHIDMNLLRSLLPFDDFDFYLCGPPLFMQALYDDLRGLNIPNPRIHAEAFGPASLHRNFEAEADQPKLPATSNTETKVDFSTSGLSSTWKPEDGKTLLELAEDAGLAPEESCRGGNCGTCRTKILQGHVTYKTRPSAKTAPDEALICCAVPAATEDNKAEPLILAL
ncbi:pyridoxamine 5'-phosphate oxidase family protein [Thalassospira alkalitolerans]|uniref:2Fe-2S iron-sulfur cluster-binding protein n=1 Tax=Thalassospira alkalitolerans TaxID=1293890 RepID=UPI003AA8F8C6